MQTKVSYIQDKYGARLLVIERENSKQAILLNEVEAEEVIATLSRHLTKRAVDEVESAPLQAESTSEVLSIEEAGTTPALRN